MNKYDDEYYIAFEQTNDDTLYLKGLKRSAERDYGSNKLSFNDEPLFFENSYKNEDKSQGVVRPIKNAHMNMNYIIISDSIRSHIKKFKISSFQLYPAVIVDDSNNFHENYWFFNI